MPDRPALDAPPGVLRTLRELLRAGIDRDRYRLDPVAFCREVLKADLTAKQESILAALVEPPNRVMVKSANNVGKSYISGCAAVWFYLTRDPACVVLTAPTARQVKDITFKEVRKLYGDRPGILPKNPRIEDHNGHLLTGFTADNEASFQGLREASNLIIFEEATGMAPTIWEAARGMLSGGSESYHLVIFNPTDSSSHAYTEEMNGGWVVLSISAFEHPNVLAELRGDSPPIPAAVRLAQLADNMREWGEWVSESDATPTDVDTWDPATYGFLGSANSSPAAADERFLAGVARHFPLRFWRPGPIGEARICGRYPRQSAYSIYSEAGFDLADRLDLPLPTAGPYPRIGCDVARFGDDCTAIHGRIGHLSLDHETYRHQDTGHTAGRLKALANAYAARFPWVDARRIPILVDDDGVGGGVTDQRGEFNFIGLHAGRTALDPDAYPNARSEAHFTVAARMAAGRLSLARLPVAVRQEIRRQALGITYTLDASGRRVAEPKHKTKARLRRSPDDLDALTLAYSLFGEAEFAGAESIPAEKRSLFDTSAARSEFGTGRRLYGR